MKRLSDHYASSVGDVGRWGAASRKSGIGTLWVRTCVRSVVDHRGLWTYVVAASL